jgi:hypothetical protein
MPASPIFDFPLGNLDRIPKPLHAALVAATISHLDCGNPVACNRSLSAGFRPRGGANGGEKTSLSAPQGGPTLLSPHTIFNPNG